MIVADAFGKLADVLDAKAAEHREDARTFSLAECYAARDAAHHDANLLSAIADALREVAK